MSKTLIVFFSRAGENYFGGAMRHIEVGNTKVVAEMLQEITEGDLFEIEQVKPYSDSYMTCIEEAKQDLEANARPAVKTFPESLNGYDTIYLCYPNYWGTMPMAVWTFLEHFDWNGKTIYPLCTNEGSGMGRSEADIQKLCPGAMLGKGLAVTGSQVQKARPSLEHWVKQTNNQRGGILCVIRNLEKQEFKYLLSVMAAWGFPMPAGRRWRRRKQSG